MTRRTQTIMALHSTQIRVSKHIADLAYRYPARAWDEDVWEEICELRRLANVLYEEARTIRKNRKHSKHLAGVQA